MCPIYLDDPTFKELPVSQKKQIARQVILDNPIAEDKAQIAERWLNTILHSGAAGEPHDLAVNMMLLSMAAIAEGKFEISYSGKSGKPSSWAKPSDALSVVDYVSHGSRVMFDLSDLSEANKTIFLSYFSKQKLNARASTHYTKRENGQLIEVKSKQHGASETAKSVFHGLGEVGGIGAIFKQFGIAGPDVTDFGIDIMMGGIGQPNLSGGISEMGMDGHLFIHSSELNSIMIGLEQTRPAFTANDVTETVLGAGRYLGNKTSRTPSPPLANDNNTTGLSGHHSMLGHSDSYTAAGSLYFSNPLYKLKYFEETGLLTPSKYNGMQVKLNDTHFVNIMDVYQALLAQKSAHDHDSILAFLNTIPKNADIDNMLVEQKKALSVYALFRHLDLGEFFKQLHDVYGEDDSCKRLFEEKIACLNEWKSALDSSNLTALSPDFKLVKFASVNDTGRQTSGDFSLLVSVGEVIASQNSHIKRLERTINYAIDSLAHDAESRLRDVHDNYCDEFRELHTLLGAYNMIDADDEQSVLSRLNEQKYQMDTLLKDIQKSLSHETVSDARFPFGYLIQIENIRCSLSEILNSNESKLILQLSYKTRLLQEQVNELSKSLKTTSSASALVSSGLGMFDKQPEPSNSSQLTSSNDLDDVVTKGDFKA